MNPTQQRTLKTPDALQKDFGIPADAGNGRAIPRVLFAYSGPDKTQFLATTISMTVAGALPEYGGKRRAAQAVTQDELAAMCGLARSTFTRRLSRFATPDDTITPERRRRMSDAMKQRKGSAGTGSEAGAGAAAEGRSRAPRGDDRSGGSALAPVVIHRQRRFANPNLYNYALPAEANPRRPECFYPAALERIRQSADVGARFQHDAGAGFKNVPAFLWDSRLPLSDTARLVMTYYICCGLLDRDPGRLGGVRGEVHPRQATVAKALGISVKSVYLANLELSGRGAAKWGVKDARTGAWVGWETSEARARALCDRRNNGNEANQQVPAKGSTRRTDIRTEGAGRERPLGDPQLGEHESGAAPGEAPGGARVRPSNGSMAGAQGTGLDPADAGETSPPRPRFTVSPLPAIALIRVVHPTPERGTDGTWRRGPAKIIYLPVRMLTHSEADAERERFRAFLMRHTGGQDPRGQALLASYVHRELLGAWAGREHRLGAFWREVRRLMLVQGVPPRLVNELVPKPPGAGATETDNS